MMERGLYVNEQRADYGFFTGALVYCLGNHRCSDFDRSDPQLELALRPTGTRDAHRHGRGYRRVVFFLLGVLLIVVSIWGFVLKLK